MMPLESMIMYGADAVGLRQQADEASRRAARLAQPATSDGVALDKADG